MISIPTHALNDGTTLPALGLGTWPLGDDEAQQAVLSALEAGYRLKETDRDAALRRTTCAPATRTRAF